MLQVASATWASGFAIFMAPAYRCQHYGWNQFCYGKRGVWEVAGGERISKTKSFMLWMYSAQPNHLTCNNSRCTCTYIHIVRQHSNSPANNWLIVIVILYFTSVNWHCLYTLTIQVNNKHIIAQEFILHEMLLKRQAAFKQLAEGLKSLGFLEVMKEIPTTFEKLFVHHDQELSGEAVTVYTTCHRNNHLQWICSGDL